MPAKTISPLKFLQAIFKTHEVVVTAKLKKTGGFTQVPRNGVSFPRWAKLKQKEAWYFCISTMVPPEPREDGSPGFLHRRREDFVACHCIVLDDVGTKVDPKLLTLKPSWILESSKGNFQYGYILSEPCTDADLIDSIIAGLADAGMTDPGSKGATHVFRVPGSYNLKNGFISRLTEWHPKRVYTPPQVQMGTTPGAVTHRSVSKTLDVSVVDVVDPLLTYMSENSWVVEDNGGNWVDITCPNAEKHTMGGDTAGYSPLGRGTGEFALYRSFKCLHGHCAKLKFKDLMKALPADAPECAPYDPLPFLQHRYGIVAGSSNNPVFIDIKTRNGLIWKYSPNAIAVLPGWRGKMMTPFRNQPVSIPTAFKEHLDTRSYNDFTYLPGTGIDVREKDVLLCNTWAPLDYAETDSLPTAFLKHLKYLIPAEHEHDAFLDSIAYKIQHPEQRTFATLMVTDEIQGVGRGILGRALKKVWGRQARSIDYAQLIGAGSQNANWNEWMSETQMVIVDEVKDMPDEEDKFKSYTVLKKRVDTSIDEIDIKRKGKESRQEHMWFNVVIFSNHLDAIILDPQDRRLLVVRNPDTPLDAAKGKKIAEAIETETAAIYWYLKRRKLTGFKPGEAIKTKSRRVMVALTLTGSAAVWRWLQQNVPGDLVTREIFNLWYNHACDQVMATEKTREHYQYRLWVRCEHLDDSLNGAQVRFTNSVTTVRSIRDNSTWSAVWRNRKPRDIKKIVEEITTNVKITTAKPFLKPTT